MMHHCHLILKMKIRDVIHNEVHDHITAKIVMYAHDIEKDKLVVV